MRENKWLDIKEFLFWQEWDKIRSRQAIHQIWHENWLKVQEIGLEAYLKQFEE